ncbi:MAG TPA: deoxyribose-phosphate aldolase, partial [Wenzhouxiangella sp.]|nr:deoxyribose-phosphate aldolase [Wenzhouxiangella sp.]
MNDRILAARQALALMDLTRLEAGDDEARIERLCQRAATSFGTVAAVCVYPQFIDTARSVLHQQGLADKVAVATVVNFPGGDEDADRVLEAIRSALTAGANEIDLVF